jgi:outer membrane protein OmpA-like peptidoglycan-associated protein
MADKRGLMTAGRRAAAPRVASPLLAVGLLLAGCSSVPKEINPVQWWRGLQGGTIAQERPAPPGDADPYPNLSTVPERPTPMDPELRKKIADALIADRANAQHVAAATPVTDPSNPATAPSLFGRGSVAPPPPPSRDEPRPAAAPPGTPSAAEAAAEAPPPAPESLPALPGNPPPPANLPGAPASAPVRSAAATPAPAAAAAAEAEQVSTRVAPVSIAFAAGSAALPRDAVRGLRLLAAHRGKGTIAVTGFGDASSDAPEAQSAALALGLARAQAIATALRQIGVPADAIRLDAEALGRGGAARLVE